MVMKNGDCSFEGGCGGKKATVLELCCGIEDYGTLSRLATERRHRRNNESVLLDMVAKSRNFLVEY